MEFLNYWLTLLWCYHMFILTDFVPSAEIRFKMGYILIAVVSFCILANLLYLNAHLPRILYNWYRMR